MKLTNIWGLTKKDFFLYIYISVFYIKEIRHWNSHIFVQKVCLSCRMLQSFFFIIFKVLIWKFYIIVLYLAIWNKLTGHHSSYSNKSNLKENLVLINTCSIWYQFSFDWLSWSLYDTINRGLFGNNWDIYIFLNEKQENSLIFARKVF